VPIRLTQTASLGNSAPGNGSVRSLRRCSCSRRGVDEVQKCAAPRGRKSRRKRLLYSVCVNRIGMADWSQCLETVIDHDVRDAPLRGAQHGRLFHHDYDRRVSAARCSRGVSCWSPCKTEVDYGAGAWEEIARRRQGPRWFGRLRFGWLGGAVPYNAIMRIRSRTSPHAAAFIAPSSSVRRALA